MSLKLAVCALMLSACASSPFVPRPSPPPLREVHVQFQAGAIDAFPAVGDVLVVDGPPGGMGSAEIAGSGVREKGNSWSFQVTGVGVTKIRLTSTAGEMNIYVRAVQRT